MSILTSNHIDWIDFLPIRFLYICHVLSQMCSRQIAPATSDAWNLTANRPGNYVKNIRRGEQSRLNTKCYMIISVSIFWKDNVPQSLIQINAITKPDITRHSISITCLVHFVLCKCFLYF